MTYQEVERLAEQLTPQEQATLIAHLLTLCSQNELTNAERKAIFLSRISHRPVNEVPSVRRVDWYDDGR